ncbi:MAG TPA: putative collagen-binding domain-containing protein, partial [Prolixibacteraceae bacterium]|nr:putative collagen-binding domain-containing protein [Prolixibacteraceae bacterium]
KSENHKRTFDNPELYDYCDVSQNNHQKGQSHWDNFQWVRNYISDHPRPINTVKTYGADTGDYGKTKDGIERWWRHLIGGAASVRFHRPTAGLGLTNITMNSLYAAREIEKIVKFWEIEPGNELLLNREENEAYLASETGKNYVVFFPDVGETGIDLSAYDSNFSLKWMNVRNGTWTEEKEIKGGTVITLTTPGENEWVAVVTIKR